MLLYADIDQAIRINVDEMNKGKLKYRSVSGTGLSFNEQNSIYINESGLY